VSEAQWKIFKFRKAATSSVVAIVVVVGACGRVKGKKQVKKSKRILQVRVNYKIHFGLPFLLLFCLRLFSCKRSLICGFVDF